MVSKRLWPRRKFDERGHVCDRTVGRPRSFVPPRCVPVGRPSWRRGTTAPPHVLPMTDVPLGTAPDSPPNHPHEAGIGRSHGEQGRRDGPIRVRLEPRTRCASVAAIDSARRLCDCYRPSAKRNAADCLKILVDVGTIWCPLSISWRGRHGAYLNGARCRGDRCYR